MFSDGHSIRICGFKAGGGLPPISQGEPPPKQEISLISIKIVPGPEILDRLGCFQDMKVITFDNEDAKKSFFSIRLFLLTYTKNQLPDAGPKKIPEKQTTT